MSDPMPVSYTHLTNLDSAREAFLEVLENYQGYRQIGILVVFDGYRAEGNPGSKTQYGNIQVVYTKEAETRCV